MARTRIHCHERRPHVHVHDRVHHVHHRTHGHRTTVIRPWWLLLLGLLIAAVFIPEVWCMLLRLGALCIYGAVLYYGYKFLFGGKHGRR